MIVYGMDCTFKEIKNENSEGNEYRGSKNQLLLGESPGIWQKVQGFRLAVNGVDFKSRLHA